MTSLTTAQVAEDRNLTLKMIYSATDFRNTSSKEAWDWQLPTSPNSIWEAKETAHLERGPPPNRGPLCTGKVDGAERSMALPLRVWPCRAPLK